MDFTFAWDNKNNNNKNNKNPPPKIFIWTNIFSERNFCQTPVLGLGLGVDFTLANNKKNNKNNKNNNNPHPNFPGWDGTRGLKFGIQT